MPVQSKMIAVVGQQFGDEGKGKLVDALIQWAIRNYRRVISCGANGGTNAGHTTYINGIPFHTHFLPTGVLTEGVIAYCGSSKVLEFMSFYNEYLKLSRYYHDLPERVFFSENIQVTLIGHLIKELQNSKDKIGTTGKGIGETYATQCDRFGINLYQIMNYSDEQLIEHIRELYSKSLSLEIGDKETVLYTIKYINDDGTTTEIDINEEILFSCRYDLENIKRFRSIWKNIVPHSYFADVFLNNEDHCYIVEMSNAVMLDITAGSIPYVTASHCTPNAIPDSLGLNLSCKIIRNIEIYGVVKSYVTRVGKGALPTEMKLSDPESAKIIVERGGEFGVTTGRERTPAFMDLVALGYSCRRSGATKLDISRGDNLTHLDEVTVCIKYLDEKGEEIIHFPSLNDKMLKVTPVYITMPGWKDFDFSTVRTFDDLHENFKAYIAKIEEYTECEVTAVNTGKERDQIVFKKY